MFLETYFFSSKKLCNIFTQVLNYSNKIFLIDCISINFLTFIHALIYLKVGTYLEYCIFVFVSANAILMTEDGF